MQVKKAKSMHIISFFNPTKILLTSSLLGYKYKYQYLKFLTTAIPITRCCFWAWHVAVVTPMVLSVGVSIRGLSHKNGPKMFFDGPSTTQWQLEVEWLKIKVKDTEILKLFFGGTFLHF